MKVLFWLLAVFSIPVGLFFSLVSWFSEGLGLVGTVFGEVMVTLGMLSILVCIACTVLGIILLRKGNMKKALVCVLLGFGYCAAILAGFAIDDAAHAIQLEKSFAQWDEQMYGENWNDPPAIDGIPERYQVILNKFYAVVRDRWSGDDLMNLGAVAMSDYYGDASLDNIGFILTDLNGDGVEELVIGAVAQPDQQGNEIFCIYSDPENPFYSINSVEGDVYYLHSGESEGTYALEIVGLNMAWAIKPVENENEFDFESWEKALDPAGRMTLALIPFSQYK